MPKRLQIDVRSGRSNVARAGRRRRRILSRLAAAALVAMAATPALAQTLFHAGDRVSGLNGGADTACLSQGQLEQYVSAKEGCPQGDPDSCAAVKRLEGEGVCGVHHEAYTVDSVDAHLGWIELSPVDDLSATYWADARDFKVAE